MPVSTVWNAETLIGTRLGSCILERPLGVGGMGAVYLARQERPRRQVAVKVLHPQLATDAKAWKVFLARFRREADAAAALDHANIVPIYEFGEEGELAYLVMPYLADGSLAELLARQGPLPVGKALAYLAQVGAALDYAHAHGVVHRDVKPSNLLLHPDGRLLLADFGIARVTGRPGEAPDIGPSAPAPDDAALTVSGRVMGTPQFMAPEQIRGGSIGPAVDLYALGMVAYTMLAGRPPFDGDTSAEVLRRQLYERPPRLGALRHDLPAQAEEVLRWPLEKAPTDRPPSAGTFVRALKDASWGRTLGATLGRDASRNFAPPPVPPVMPPPQSGAYGHDALTVYDGGQPAQFGGSGPPQWPGAGMWAHPPAPQRRRRRNWLAIVSAVAAVLLMLIVLRGLATGSPRNAGFGEPSSAVRPTPTATHTPSPTPTPTPPPNWLSVKPSHISLACGGTKTVKVTLRNLGDGDTNWFAAAPFLGGVSVSPLFGPLPSRNSLTITITNTSAFIGHDDKIQFKPDNKDAGDPAVLSYTTQPC
jgi:hypothetical protein